MKVFIIEGTDGVGKSTFIQEMKSKVSTPANFIKFPTRYPDIGLTMEEEIEFYLSDFKEHLAKLTSETVLICDRSFLSTLAYQGFKPGTVEPNEHFDRIWEESVGIFFPKPAQVRLFYIQLVCDLDIALKRTGVRLEGLKEGEIDAIDRLDPVTKRKELNLLNERYDYLYSKLWTLGLQAMAKVRLDTSKTKASELAENILRIFPTSP